MLLDSRWTAVILGGRICSGLTRRGLDVGAKRRQHFAAEEDIAAVDDLNGQTLELERVFHLFDAAPGDRRGRVRAADNLRRHKCVDLIDELLVEEAAEQAAAALDKDAGELALGERGEELALVELAVCVLANLQKLDTSVGERASALA